MRLCWCGLAKMESGNGALCRTGRVVNQTSICVADIPRFGAKYPNGFESDLPGQAVQLMAISPNSAALAGGHYAFRKPPEFRRRFKEDVQWRHLRVRILQPQPGSPVFGMSRPREFAQHSRGLRRRWRVSVADFSCFKEALAKLVR